MRDEENNHERRDGAGRRVAALALSLGALAAPAAAASPAAAAPAGASQVVTGSEGGGSALEAIRAQFEGSFTPGAVDEGWTSTEVEIGHGSGAAGLIGETQTPGKVGETQPGKVGETQPGKVGETQPGKIG
jgi:hypothetical protein